jgi:spermidine synthase
MTLASVDTMKSGAVSRKNTASLAVFVITLFVSAFLLFSVQPFFAKMVLPRLGGSPAVWSVAMVFFQAMLLAGYLYAHLLSTYLTPRLSALVHVVVMCAALIFMPITIAAGWGNPPETGQPIWLLGLFTASVGLPFFAVAANGPLLQSWFSKSGHPHAADPYFLYSASNLGSFASLFLFIVLIEPNLSVPEISRSWMLAFIALGVLIMACAVFVNAAAPVTNQSSATLQTSTVEPIAPMQLAKWIGLSFVPSGLLVAVTAFISTDIAAVPFLWIVPLSLFLLTFILAFAQRRIFSVQLLSQATAILAVAVLCLIPLGHHIPVAAKLALHVGFFFIAALLCHSVLVDQRPSSGRLTAFYLWMSFGGVLGGVFASLLAPVLFTSIAEYPILVILALFCRPSTWHGDVRRLFITTGAAAFVGLVLLNPSFADSAFMQNKAMLVSLFLLFAGLSWVYLFRNETWFIVQAILALGLMLGIMNANKILSVDRSFFGVVSVYESPDQQYVLMSHGSTLHGAMAITPEGQKPEPLTYYHRTGGIAASLFATQQKWALSPLGRDANVGIVGLGAGSMLCHRKPGERWTSYEIDKAVVTAASDPKLFRFVSDCGMNDPIIIGDGRLKLVEEPDAKFDYLLIDAFSSDSIPVHLLTDEAFQLYFSKLADDGVLTVHISNRYLELASIIQAIAQKNGYVGRFGTFKASEELAAMKVTTSMVIVLARNNSALGSIADSSQWGPLPDLGTKPWTDDYSDMIGALMRGYYK